MDATQEDSEDAVLRQMTHTPPPEKPGLQEQLKLFLDKDGDPPGGD